MTAAPCPRTSVYAWSSDSPIATPPATCKMCGWRALTPLSMTATFTISPLRRRLFPRQHNQIRSGVFVQQQQLCRLQRLGIEELDRGASSIQVDAAGVARDAQAEADARGH